MSQDARSAAVLPRLRQFMQDAFLYMRPDAAVSDEESLLEGGILDSMGVIELVQFLEAEFGIRVADADITENNLGTLAAIGRYVNARRGGA